MLKYKDVIEAARKRYGEEGILEIDDKAQLSIADPPDGGLYVQAWVWLSVGDLECSVQDIATLRVLDARSGHMRWNVRGDGYQWTDGKPHCVVCEGKHTGRWGAHVDGHAIAADFPSWQAARKACESYVRLQLLKEEA